MTARTFAVGDRVEFLPAWTRATAFGLREVVRDDATGRRGVVSMLCKTPHEYVVTMDNGRDVWVNGARLAVVGGAS